MKSRNAAVPRSPWKSYRSVLLPALLLVLLGIANVNGTLELAGYLLAVCASVLPAFLWIRAGSRGVPVLPAFAAMHLLYYAVPLVTENVTVAYYSPWELWRAEATVSVFLFVVTLAAGILPGRVPRPPLAGHALLRDSQVIWVTFTGLATGVFFQVAAISGTLSMLGPSFGAFRSASITCTTLACYVLGVGRAQGALRGAAWQLAVAGLVAVVLLSWSSLFLVMGMLFCFAALLGYTISTKRVPWPVVTPTIIVIFILHAGKAEMRERYWEPGSQGSGVYSVRQVPAIAAEWITTGLSALRDGAYSQTVIDRASLLQLLLFVQQRTPSEFEFLGGATYSLLPGMVIPRFLAPNKTTSQAAMSLLNIHYGFQTEESASHTAIGWGLIAEAYANFGYRGVIGVALLVGTFIGAISRWSGEASAFSLPTVLAIVAMMNLIGLEADLSYLTMNLWVALASMFVFFAALRLLIPGKHTGIARPSVVSAPRFNSIPRRSCHIGHSTTDQPLRRTNSQ